MNISDTKHKKTKQQKQQNLNHDKFSLNKSTKAKDGVMFSMEDLPSLPMDASVEGGATRTNAQLQWEAFQNQSVSKTIPTTISGAV